MPWTTKDGQRYWVGIHQPMGLVVFDPSDQLDLKEDRVRLFLMAQLRIAKFQTSIARERILVNEPGQPDDVGPDEADQAAAAYLAFVAAEQRRILAERHADYLAAKGLPQAGMRGPTRKHRETHCYCHRAWLDNRIHMECDRCGMIICYVCGGCFC